MALVGVELETLVSEPDALTTRRFFTCTYVMPAAEVIEPSAIRL